jgi:hypothetical protein
MRRFLFYVAVLAVAGAVLLPVGIASATAPPVGPLPPGVVAHVTTSKGSLIAVALPKGARGLVWRLARRVNTDVVRQTGEADVGSSVVVIFRTVGSGNAKIVFALTWGERRKAYAAVKHVVRVR